MTPKSSTPQADSTNALLNQPLALRRDVRCHIRGGADAAVLEDPVSGKHYRLGPAEYGFVVRADRSGSFAEAWRRMESSQQSSALPISRTQAEAVYVWLIASGISEVGIPAVNRSAPLWRRWNPIIFRCSLGNPDWLLERLARATRCVSGPLAALILTLLFAVAVWALVGDFTRFCADINQLVTVPRVLVLIGLWCLLKVIHEVGHGLVCKRLGGEVQDVGLAFILFAPVAYTDVSSSSAFPARWQRIAVALAGVVAELCAAAVAILIWRTAESPDLQRAAIDAALMASISTLAFNANPLMRFDGYFVLAECLGVDNLYELGQKSLRRMLGRILGAPAVNSSASRRSSVALAAYGLACWLWRLGLGLALIVASASLFHGAGIFFAALAAVSWFVAPAIGWIRRCLQTATWRREDHGNLALRLAAVAIAVAVVSQAPPPVFSTASGIVQPSPPAVIRCRTAGFVKTVHVDDGQQVRKGDPILTLHDDVLASELASMEIQWHLARQRERAWHWQRDASQLLLARAKATHIQEKLQELRQRHAELVIRAQADGAVAARRIKDLEGVYLGTGDLVGEVGNPESKQLMVSLLPKDADRIQAGEPVRATTPSGEWFEGRISRVTPRAAVELPHPALASIHGGTLAIELDDAHRQRFVRPRVTAYVELTPVASRRLRSGQTCTVVLGSKTQTLLQWSIEIVQSAVGL